MTSLVASFRDQMAIERLDVVKTPREPVLAKVGKLAAKLLVRAERMRTAAMATAGFGCLSAAAWTFHMSAGLAAVGVSLLILEYLSGGQK